MNNGTVEEVKKIGEEIKEHSERTARKVASHPSIGWLARLGFISRGIIYVLVGILAVQVALGGRGGQLTDPQGAIARIAREQLGEILLILIAVGLLGYTLWNIMRAVMDPEHEGNGIKGLLVRAGYVISAVSHGVLLFVTLRVLLGLREESSSEKAEQASATILTQPYGSWFLGLAGLILIGAGIGGIVVASRKDFGMRFEQYALSKRQEIWIQRLGRFGTVARGVVFGIVGVLVLYAAIKLDPELAGGMDEALFVLSQQTYGMILLAIVSIGLIAFGIYSLLGAAWFRIDQPDSQ